MKHRLSKWASQMPILLFPLGAALCVPAVVTAAPASAVQDKSEVVSGEVLDASGEPLIGASVLVKETKQGVVTDLDGKFRITASKGSTLVVSYIGCKTKEVRVTDPSLVITLDDDNSVLGEVVVVGYGTQKKETLTGAVTVVTDKALANKGTLSSPVQALQGQVPGVVITRGSSAPGDESWNMSLRGAVSKNSTPPLVIIDGVEYESVNELRLLNPSDIESINFLKDAAASIYGSKAAGGVVLVTTKNAKEAGRVKVEYSGSYTFKNIGLSAELMSLDQWADAVVAARTNDGYGSDDTWIKYAKMAKQYRNKYIDLRHSVDPIGLGDIDDLVFFDTDWQDIMWGNSWSTQHELSVSGGTEKNLYRLSGGYMYDDSNLKWGNNHNQRVNFRLNNTFKLSDKLTLQSVIGYNRQDQVAPTQIGSALNTNSQQPGFPASTIDGKPYGWGGSKWATPNWLCELGGDNWLKVSAINISETLRYEIIPGLTANAVVGYNTSSATRDVKSEAIDFYNYAGDKKLWQKPTQSDSYYESSFGNTDFYSLQGYLNWSHTFKKDHSLALMGGWQYNYKTYKYAKTKVKDIQSSMDIPNGSGEVTIPEAHNWEEAIMSYYGRLNYGYQSKYLIEGQFRYDGSSKFQADNRWAFFWGVSAGWRIDQEKFMEGTRNWLSNLKLRASYGNVGNQSGIDRYSGQMLYKFTQTGKVMIGGQMVSTIDTNGKLISLDRSWERVHNYNVGLDFGLFDNKLSGTVETFWKKTNNMLIDVTYPHILGDAAPTANLGKFKAWGYEGSVSWNDKIGDVSYHIGGTFTYVDNELVDNGGSGALKSGVRSDREGYPLNSVFGLRYCGKIQTEEQLRRYKERYASNSSVGNIGLLRLGDNMFQDVNDDGKLDANDYVYLGTDDPKIQFSFNFGAEWKGFDVNFIFQGAAKRTVWRTDGNNNPDIWRIPQRAVYMNQSNHWIGDVWSLDNPGGNYPSLTNQSDINTYNYQCSSWSVEDGSYLRLKNVTVGYTLPKNVIAKTKVISNLRIYATGTDLWEISHIKDGWDPEAARTITAARRYPFLRTWTIGANITF